MLFYKIPWSTLNVPWVTNVSRKIFEHGDGDSWEPEDDLELLDSDESEND